MEHGGGATNYGNWPHIAPRYFKASSDVVLDQETNEQSDQPEDENAGQGNDDPHERAEYEGLLPGELSFGTSFSVHDYLFGRFGQLGRLDPTINGITFN